MPRKYKRTYTNFRNGKSHKPYGSYSKENLNIAVELVRKGLMSIPGAAHKYRIPQSTIGRLARKPKIYENAGRPCIFTEDEEKIFLNHLDDK
ncbi:unnamed protein product [Bemisia tabaci]|uniref:HTH psq-type domain-containing protein n=1 Tax=Bemisia tabaci TaxID=7038 RepID=A0A9P0G2Q3_BEMTA|nr:unnamed protein product [Bemisia tabaci]